VPESSSLSAEPLGHVGASRPATRLGSEVRLGEIASWLQAEVGAEFVGDADVAIDRIGPLDAATPTTITFLSSARYQAQLSASQAACVIVSPAMRELAVARGATIVASDPYRAYARLSQWWAMRARPQPAPGIHPSAVVDPAAVIDPSASIGPLAVVEAHAVVGPGAVIGAHTVVGEGATIGADTRLAANVTFGYGCSIGDRGIIHSGAVIGADGFGFAPHQGRWEKIEQLGAVRIGHDVEIGANTCIDRGALSDTVIEEGVKIDDLVMIAHNVHIKAHVAMAGCSAVAGSATIGAHCTIAGAARVIGHLELADHVHISVASVVTRSIRQPGVYSGVYPIDDNASWEKNAATLRQLHSLRDRIRQLEKKNTP
jgi:UDP-3-O-[3-hydroxymyristoyl] glucosamine N-acyltransferase